MTRLLLILMMSFYSVSLFSQTDCQVENEYGNIFKIEKLKYGQREILLKTVNEIDPNSCFSELINNNSQYIDYLKTNFSDNSNYEKLLSITDTVELQKEYINSLENDSLFNRVMQELVDRYDNRLTYIPDTISVDELLNIAVKYFSISKINQDGYYVGKVCTGINGLEQTESVRKPQIEAFCYSTLLNNYRGERFNLYDEFVKAIKELYKVNLGVESEDRLLRAQGAMYMLMRNNEKLKELLLSEYEVKKDYLPFVIKI
jgi:hypothetical protein